MSASAPVGLQTLRDHRLERVEIHSLNNSEGMAPSSTDQMGQIWKRTAESRLLDRTIYSVIVNLPQNERALCYGGWQWCESMAHAAREV